MIEVFLTFALFILLILTHGLFVAAEFAIVNVRANNIAELLERDEDAVRHIQKVVDNPSSMDYYIATSQIGMTLISLFLGVYGIHTITIWFLQWIDRWVSSGMLLWYMGACVFSISLLTWLHVVLGEILPKSIARHAPEQTAILLDRFMRMMTTILSPVIVVVNLAGNGLLRLIHVPRIETYRRIHSPEDLELVVTESHRGGLLSDDEQTIIQNIFDLSERRVGQAMNPRPRIEAIPIDMPQEELREYVVTSPYSRFPVYEEDLDHIVGLLLVRDFVQQQLEKPDEFDLKSLLRPMPAVPEAMTVDRLLLAFKHSHVHMSLVFDEYGVTAGVVTLEDVVEEVVGEVHDEFDQIEQPLLYEFEPGMFFARGDLMLDDLIELVPGILPDEEDEENELPDVDTIGGLVVSLLGRPAQPSDSVEMYNTIFTVESVSGFAVDMVRIVRQPEKQEDEADEDKEEEESR